MEFKEHKEQTAKDLEEVGKIFTDAAAQVREGNLELFEQIWIEGGTEEGDATIFSIREISILRYFARREQLGNPEVKEDIKEESENKGETED